MPRNTVLLAILLFVLGAGFWLGTGRQSVTALIPAFFAVPLGACGLLAGRPGLRAHAMHVAAALALLGLAGTAPGVVKFARRLGGETIARPEAATAQTIMALLCLAYVVLAVRSFVTARLLRKQD